MSALELDLESYFVISLFFTITVFDWHKSLSAIRER